MHPGTKAYTRAHTHNGHELRIGAGKLTFAGCPVLDITVDTASNLSTQVLVRL